MIKAMRENDTAFDGRFYVGVLSTRIYCLPSCKAKLPLLKNVVFLNSREEAIAIGLRGCKRCRSESFPDTLPKWVKPMMRYLKETCTEKLNEQKLMKATGVEISTIRRYFKMYHHTTPLAFHRRVRLNYAMSLLSRGASYLDAAYESGWESASGFREAFKKQFGHPPGRFYHEHN